MLDQAQSLRELMSRKKPKGSYFITVAAGAAGVGVTTLAFNLAYALQQAGFRPLVVQLTDYLGENSKTGLVQALRNKKDLLDLVVEYAGGIRCLPQSDLLGLLGFSASLVRNSLKQLDKLADLVIFTARGRSKEILQLLAASHQSFILLSPERDALLGAYAILKSLAEAGRNSSLRLVLNKAPAREKAELIMRSFAKTTFKYTNLALEADSFIRQDDAVAQHGEVRGAFWQTRPDSAAALDLAKIAAGLEEFLTGGSSQRDTGSFLAEFLKEA